MTNLRLTCLMRLAAISVLGCVVRKVHIALSPDSDFLKLPKQFL